MSTSYRDTVKALVILEYAMVLLSRLTMLDLGREPLPIGSLYRQCQYQGCRHWDGMELGNGITHAATSFIGTPSHRRLSSPYRVMILPEIVQVYRDGSQTANKCHALPVVLAISDLANGAKVILITDLVRLGTLYTI